MNNPTELEVCCKMAELEGAFKTVVVDKSVVAYFKVGSGIHTYESAHHNYNPITDKALILDNMIKYEVTPVYVDCPAGTGKAFGAEIRGGFWSEWQGNLGMAVCLTILKSEGVEV